MMQAMPLHRLSFFMVLQYFLALGERPSSKDTPHGVHGRSSDMVVPMSRAGAVALTETKISGDDKRIADERQAYGNDTHSSSGRGMKDGLQVERSGNTVKIVQVGAHHKAKSDTGKTGSHSSKKETHTLTLNSLPSIGGQQTHHTHLTTDMSSGDTPGSQESIVHNMQTVETRITHKTTELKRLQGTAEDRTEELQTDYEAKLAAAEIAKTKFINTNASYVEAKRAYDESSKRAVVALAAYQSLQQSQKDTERQYIRAWKTYRQQEAEMKRAEAEANLASAKRNGHEEKIKQYEHDIDTLSQQMEADSQELTSMKLDETTVAPSIATVAPLITTVAPSINETVYHNGATKSVSGGICIVGFIYATMFVSINLVAVS